MRFSPVIPPVHIWPLVLPLLAPALHFGGHTPQEVAEKVESGLAQLWIAHEGDDVAMAVVTEKRGDQCQIWLCGGRDMTRWLHFIGVLEDWARTLGCTSMRIDGRPGWERMLPGWRRTAVTLERGL